MASVDEKSPSIPFALPIRARPRTGAALESACVRSSWSRHSARNSGPDRPRSARPTSPFAGSRTSPQRSRISAAFTDRAFRRRSRDRPSDPREFPAMERRVRAKRALPHLAVVVADPRGGRSWCRSRVGGSHLPKTRAVRRRVSARRRPSTTLRRERVRTSRGGGRSLGNRSRCVVRPPRKSDSRGRTPGPPRPSSGFVSRAWHDRGPILGARRHVIDRDLPPLP